jgi:hypothetical protein
MKLLTILLISMTLLGCAQFNDIVTGYGERASRQLFVTSKYAHCVAMPIGEVLAQYDTKEKLKAYTEFCNTDIEKANVPSVTE